MYWEFSSSPTDSIIQPLEYLNYSPACAVMCECVEHSSGFFWLREGATYTPGTRDREGHDSLGGSSRDHTFGNLQPLLGRNFCFCFPNHPTCWAWARAGKTLTGLQLPKVDVSTSWTPPAGCGPRRTQRERVTQQGAGPAERLEEEIKPDWGKSAPV